jgi:hypothetical protein
MRLGDSDDDDDVRAEPCADGSNKPPRRPGRRRSRSQILVELEGVRRLRDESIRSNRLREAGELSQELEGLVEEYFRQPNGRL